MSRVRVAICSHNRKRKKQGPDTLEALPPTPAIAPKERVLSLMNERNTAQPRWEELLQKAVSEPGIISQAYSRFHNYSLGNQLLAMSQCHARELPVGPIGTFMHWKENGRFVRKGEKAIQLCMPVTGKRTAERHNDETGQDDQVEVGYTRFVYRNNWFVLSQTDGADYTPAAMPEWNEAKALQSLEVTRVDFTMTDGNCQGYAQKRTVAISPLAEHPTRTLLHELAHVVLGHTLEGTMNDSGERT